MRETVSLISNTGQTSGYVCEAVGESYVGGRWLKHRYTDTISLLDPSTCEPRVGLKPAESDLVNRAANAARSALERGWCEASVEDRCNLLRALSNSIDCRSEDFAFAISSEIGAPIDYARVAHVKRSLDLIASTISALRATESRQSLTNLGTGHSVLWEPCGIAGLITPWNWPLNQIIVKVASAVAAGCSVLLKPSDLTPVTAHLFALCVEEVEPVPGLINVLLGDAELARKMVSHIDVDVVSFSGSTDVGRQVAASAASTLKPAVLELGGKSASIVFADSDLTKAIEGTVAGCMRNSGQACNASSRLLVERSVYADALTIAGEITEAMTLGSAHVSGSHLGPVATERQMRSILYQIDKAKSNGARVVTKGAQPPQTGFFIVPTVLSDIAPSSSIFQQEVFGPVLTVTPFDNTSEAIWQANHGPYGLAAQIWSDDVSLAASVASKLDVGMVQVNGAKRHPHAPFSGRHASGYGCEAGPLGIRAFQRTKSISGIDLRRYS